MTKGDENVKQGTIGEAISASKPEPKQPEPSEPQQPEPPAGPVVEPPTEAIEPVAPAPAAPSAKAPVLMAEHGVMLQDIESLWRFSTMVHRSGLAPKGITSIEAIAVAIQLGLEIGLPPMAALQNTAVINGRPGIFGDAALALCYNSGLVVEFDEWFEHDGVRVERWPAKPNDTTTAVCWSQRKGRSKPVVSTFSVGDAKTAKLWLKTGAGGQDTPWITYPWRMLRFRARGFNLRDNFPDVLKGFKTYEELADTPEESEEDAPIAMPTRASATDTTARTTEPAS